MIVPATIFILMLQIKAINHSAENLESWAQGINVGVLSTNTQINIFTLCIISFLKSIKNHLSPSKFNWVDFSFQTKVKKRRVGGRNKLIFFISYIWKVEQFFSCSANPKKFPFFPSLVLITIVNVANVNALWSLNTGKKASISREKHNAE